MAPEAQLEWEARAGRAAAYVAFGSALLIIAGGIYRAIALEERPTDASGYLAALDDKSADFIVAAGFQSLGVLLLAPVLYYLYRAAKYRRPQLPPVAGVLAIAGPAAVGVAGLVLQIAFVGAAGAFVAEGPPTAARADAALRSGAPSVIGSFGFAASVALGFAFVLVSFNAMRAGLLSRFLGILGVIVGILYVLPVLGGPQVIQLFWIAALGLLFIGRWPGGRGPAWERGEAIPWPSAAQQRAEAARDGEESGGGSDPASDEARLEAPSRAPDGPEPSPPSPGGERANRKRRR